MQLICATSCAWYAKCTCSCSKDAAASTAESKNRRPSLETARERERGGERGREGASKRQAGSDKQFKLPSNSHTAHSSLPSLIFISGWSCHQPATPSPHRRRLTVARLQLGEQSLWRQFRHCKTLEGLAINFARCFAALHRIFRRLPRSNTHTHTHTG